MKEQRISVFFLVLIFSFSITFLVFPGRATAEKDASSLEKRVANLEGQVTLLQNIISALQNVDADHQNQLNDEHLAILGLEQEVSGIPKVGFADNSLGMQVTLLNSPVNNVTKDIIPVTLNAPSDGFAIIIGDGYFLINHVYGTQSVTRISLTGVQNGPINTGSFTTASFPAGAPTGYYEVPFSVTRRVPVVAGSTTFYMNGIASGNGSIGMTLPHITAIFFEKRY